MVQTYEANFGSVTNNDCVNDVYRYESIQTLRMVPIREHYVSWMALACSLTLEHLKLENKAKLTAQVRI